MARHAAAGVPPRTVHFNAQVESEVARRVQSSQTEQAAALAAATAAGQRTAALATLGAMIAGNPGDTVDALKFRGAVQDMVLAIHAGGDMPPAEHVAEAMRLNEARVQQIAATSGETAEVRAARRGPRRWEPGRLPDLRRRLHGRAVQRVEAARRRPWTARSSPVRLKWNTPPACSTSRRMQRRIQPPQRRSRTTIPSCAISARHDSTGRACSRRRGRWPSRTRCFAANPPIDAMRWCRSSGPTTS